MRWNWKSLLGREVCHFMNSQKLPQQSAGPCGEGVSCTLFGVLWVGMLLQGGGEYI